MSWSRPVFVFPGQGSQSVGMGRDLDERSPAAHEVFTRAQSSAGFDLPDLCFNGPADLLTLTEYQQPCILAASLAALAALAERFDMEPLCAVGHSLGEYSALVASGSLRMEDAVRLTRKRGAFMQHAVPEGAGAMAALLGTEETQAEELCRESGGRAWVANLNGAGQVIVSGEAAAVRRVCDLARSAGIRRTAMLPVSAPFHSPMMEPAAARFQKELEETEFSSMSFPVIANVDAEPNRNPAILKDLLLRQITSRVLFERSIRKAAQMGADAFLEIGPGGKLAALIRRIVQEIPCETVATYDDISKLEAMRGR